MNALQQVLNALRARHQRIKTSGPIAPAGLWIEVYCPGGRNADTSILILDRHDI